MDESGATGPDMAAVILIDIPQQIEGIDAEDEHYEGQIAEETLDDEEWFEMRLHARWKEVMQRLLRKEIRWDDDNDAGGDERNDEWKLSTGVLDTKKKTSLAETDRYDKTSPTVLHRLALDFGSDGFSDLAPRTQIKIIEYLLQERVRNPQHAVDEDPILTRAIEYDNFEFIWFILKHCARHLPDLLDARDIRGANCLHYFFEPHLPEAVEHFLKTNAARRAGKHFKVKKLALEATIPILGEFVKHARPSTVTACDNFGNAPIHYAMEYKICRMPIIQYPGHVLELIKIGDKAKNRDGQFNKKKESPYLYFLRTQGEYLASLRKQSQERARTNGANASTAKAKIVSHKMAKYETPDYKAVAPGQVGRHVDVSSKGASLKDVSRKVNPKDLSAAKGRPETSAPMAPPSQDGREESKRDNVASAKDAQLMDVPPGHGLGRTRTADLSNAPAFSKAHAALPGAIAYSRAQDGILASPIEKASTSSQAGDLVGSAKPRPMTQTGAEKQVPPGPVVTEDHKQFRDAAESIRRKLKLHYIRSRPDMEAKELLYGKVASGMCFGARYLLCSSVPFFHFSSLFLHGCLSYAAYILELMRRKTDKNLYFDATHLKGKSPGEVAGLILMLANPGGFEDTLSYVNLPVLGYTPDSLAGSTVNAKSYDANERRPRDSGGNEDKLIGRNSVVAVFDKLAEVGVRNILRLIVEEDTKSPPHTDGAIERAVRGEDSLNPESKRKEPSIAVEIWYVQVYSIRTVKMRIAIENKTDGMTLRQGLEEIRPQH